MPNGAHGVRGRKFSSKEYFCLDCIDVVFMLNHFIKEGRSQHLAADLVS